MPSSPATEMRHAVYDSDMKPRVILAETPSPEGGTLELHEHDGRRYLMLNGGQLAGPATRTAEQELAKIASQPFRPVRQPYLWVVGLGLGELLNALTAELPQKKATFYIEEPLDAIRAWQKEYFSESSYNTDPRVDARTPQEGGLASCAPGSLHGILAHLDYAPMSGKGKTLAENRKWLAQAYEALQTGGILALAASRSVRGLERSLTQSGFDVAFHQIEMAPNAKKSRLVPLWLARKGKFVSRHR